MGLVETVASTFASCGDHPEAARGQCIIESAAFVEALAAAGVAAEVISGYRLAQNHSAVRVGGVVYDWTARQFPPHDQPWPLIQPIAEWRAEWPAPGSNAEWCDRCEAETPQVERETFYGAPIRECGTCADNGPVNDDHLVLA